MRVFQTVEPSSRRARRSSVLALIGFTGLCLLAWLAGGTRGIGFAPGWTVAPGWPVAPGWAVLPASVGVSAWLVWRRVDVATHRKRTALRVWGCQVLASGFWPAALATGGAGLGMAVVSLLLVSVVATILAFWPLHRMAAAMLIPYMAFTGFAALHSTGFW